MDEEEREDFLELLEGFERLCKNDPRLTCLNVSDIDDDKLFALSFFLRNNTRLKKLELHSSRVSHFGIEVLVEKLGRNRSIETLSMNSSTLGFAGAFFLSKLLKSDVSRIKVLHIDGCGIGVEGVTALVDGLKHNNTVTFLSLANDSFGDAGARVIAETAPGDIKLKYLDLSRDSIKEWGASLLSVWLYGNTFLEELDLTGNKVGCVGGESFGKMLSNNKTLLTLDLTGNSIGDIGATGIGEGLLHNCTLTKLSLEGNDISEIGVSKIARAIGKNTGLKRLRLYGHEGLHTLVSALHTNQSLVEVFLPSSNVGDEGVNALADALRHNSSVKFIDLSYNGIGVVGVRALCSVLKSDNDTVKELILRGNSLGNPGASLVAELIANNSCIETLCLESNGIGDDGMKMLCEALKSTNHSVKELNLCYNTFGLAGCCYVADMLSQDSCLQRLEVSSGFRHKDEDAAAAIPTLSAGLKSNKSLQILGLCGFGSLLENDLLAIKEGIKNHFSLEKIYYHYYYKNSGLEELDAYITFHCEWNRNGRYLLEEENVPTSLWANIIAKASGAFEADIVFSFLLEKPDIFNLLLASDLYGNTKGSCNSNKRPRCDAHASGHQSS